MVGFFIGVYGDKMKHGDLVTKSYSSFYSYKVRQLSISCVKKIGIVQKIDKKFYSEDSYKISVFYLQDRIWVWWPENSITYHPRSLLKHIRN